MPPSVSRAQSEQKVHSKVQIIAPGRSGGRGVSQHSQLGRISSILLPHRMAVGGRIAAGDMVFQLALDIAQK